MLFSVWQAAAQAPGSNANVPARSGPPLYLRDLFSTPLQPKTYAGFEGTPFLEDSWVQANLKVDGNRHIDSIFIKMNLYEKKIHFRNEGGEEMVITMNVNEIRITDSNSVHRNAVFLLGFEQDRNGFFQLITDGKKMKLLKKISVYKWETKPFGEEVKRRFEITEQLYLFANDRLYEETKNCLSVATAFLEKNDALPYISSNGLRCNKLADLVKLVEFMNTASKIP